MLPEIFKVPDEAWFIAVTPVLPPPVMLPVTVTFADWLMSNAGPAIFPLPKFPIIVAESDPVILVKFATAASNPLAAVTVTVTPLAKANVPPAAIGADTPLRNDKTVIFWSTVTVKLFEYASSEAVGIPSIEPVFHVAVLLQFPFVIAHLFAITIL